jgi:hypothetical protein
MIISWAIRCLRLSDLKTESTQAESFARVAQAGDARTRRRGRRRIVFFIIGRKILDTQKN